MAAAEQLLQRANERAEAVLVDEVEAAVQKVRVALMDAESEEIHANAEA